MSLKLVVRVPRGPLTCTVRDLIFTSQSSGTTILLFWCTVFIVGRLQENDQFCGLRHSSWQVFATAKAPM